MIGVAAAISDREAVRELFELFKTPWEPWRPGARYQVVILADPAADPRHHPAPLVVVYGSQPTAFDHGRGRLPGAWRREATLIRHGERIPVYRGCVGIDPEGRAPALVLEETGEPVAAVVRAADDTAVARVGYDLFREVRHLLTAGQPPEHAAVPAIERHIAFLRGLILAAGLPLVELPPVPAGHPFAACLTHDLDHPGIRFHGLDHSVVGFLYRAVVGSVVGAWRGQAAPGAVRRNLRAAAALPFVRLGLAADCWAGFDRYLEIDPDGASTFFVIPVKGDPGRGPGGPAPRIRAAAYGAADIADRLQALQAAGAEVGLHGIDAWRDSARGVEEGDLVARAAGAAPGGVRMHWLYFDEHAPERLEAAGFAYDSTFGYNGAVGFRAGTLQPFRPLAARRLLELPLHIMDTALFYPSHLGLTQDSARPLVWNLVAEAARHGGALTVNWHDRSLAPERLWGEFYAGLVAELARRGAWFATGSRAVAWFRLRRSATFGSARWDGSELSLGVAADPDPELPALTLRVHLPDPGGAVRITDLAFRGTLDARVPFADHVRIPATAVGTLEGSTRR